MRPDPDEGEKRTNEIGTLLPLLDTVPDIAGHTLTTDALLTQRALATSLLGRGAHDLVTVKGNQPTIARRYPPRPRRAHRPAGAGLHRQEPETRARPS